MPRKKEIKTGCHLKVIPAGRLDDLKILAKKFPHIKDAETALWKYVEAFSTIVDLCSNSDIEFTPVNMKILATKLGVKDPAATRIIEDLIDKKIIIRDKSKFEFGIHSWEYKPVGKLESIMINRNYINRSTTDKMLLNIIKYKGDLLEYYNIVSKLTMDISVLNYINNSINCSAIYDMNFVPFGNDKNCEYMNSVPYAILGRIPRQVIPVFKLLAGKYRVSRPIKNSRVYSNITNLKREFRKFLRLNGKPLIGIDIKNSQPLIAAIAFRKYSEEEYHEIKPDVMEYQQACQEGRFYEYFMELKGIDMTCEDARTDFKKDFFAAVFYSMVTDADNELKTWFKEKYPTCFEAMNIIKGGRYSRDYKNFPAMMTKFETAIIFETNMELIRMGYDVVNIFDSVYSDSEEAITLAKQMITEKFQECGITPSFKDIDEYLLPDPQDKQNNTTMKEPTTKKQAANEAPKHSQYIEHTLTDDTPIFNQQYFIDEYGMDAEFATECYHSQFHVDLTQATNGQDYAVLKKRQSELAALLHLT